MRWPLRSYSDTMTNSRIKLVLTTVDTASPKSGFSLTDLPCTIGRGAEATIQVDDRWASRLHCQIDERDNGYLVRDLGSRFGTLLNGEHILEAVLCPGDKLTVGLTTFRVTFESKSSKLKVQTTAASAS